MTRVTSDPRNAFTLVELGLVLQGRSHHHGMIDFNHHRNPPGEIPAKSKQPRSTPIQEEPAK